MSIRVRSNSPLPTLPPFPPSGWFIFSIYVGIGFVALPLDSFSAFRHRPKVLTASEARAQRKVLLSRSTELLRVGEDLAAGIVNFSDEMHSKKERRKKNKVDAGEMNRFRVLVDMLEADLEQFQLCDPKEYREHYNPLVPWFKLVFSVFAALLSAAWIIQIIVYMCVVGEGGGGSLVFVTRVPPAPTHPPSRPRRLFTPPLYGFMNNYLTWFDGFFPLFGTLTLALFGLYLCVCGVDWVRVYAPLPPAPHLSLPPPLLQPARGQQRRGQVWHPLLLHQGA